MATDVTYQLDIYDAAGTSVAITYTSITGGTNPYLSTEPTGDGQAFDPLTGETRAGEYTGQISDEITSGTDRAVTSQLEDAGFRQQLMRRKAILKMILDGSATIVLCAGRLTRLTLATVGVFEYAVTDPSQLGSTQKIFTPRLGIVRTTATAAIAATSVAVGALDVAIAKNTTLNFGGGKTAVVSAAAAAGATSISFAALTYALANGDVAQYKEPIATFLARWPNRGCAFGGPVIGGFLNQPDTKGWEMVFESTGALSIPVLRFVRGSGPPSFAPVTDVNHPSIAKATNDRVGGWEPRGGTAIDGTPNILTTAITTFDQAERSGFAGDLMIEVMHAIGGAMYGYFQPGIYALNGNDPPPLVTTGQSFANGARGVFISGMSMAQLITAGMPASGTAVRVRAWTPNPSDISPVYWTGHPVELVTTVLTELGYSYDATSATTVTQTLGADLRLSIKVTEAQDGPAFIAANALGPFGIGLRMKDNGDMEFFASRALATAAPSVEITDDDLITPDEGGSGPAFSVTEATAVQKVTWTFKQLKKTTGAVPDFSPDGFTARDYTIERINVDPGVVGTRVQAYQVAGMVHSVGRFDVDVGFFDAASLEIFDRLGRGAIETELPLLRGMAGDPVRLGDEVSIAITQIPNQNKRYGDDHSVGGRAMQMVRYTPRKEGALAKFLDSGPNAGAFGTAPTISIAASSDFPKRVAMLTITNAATLNAAGAGARVRMATIIDGASAPASTDYADVMAFPPGQIPTGAFALPSVIAGRKVYAKAAATKPGSRQSAYSSAANVLLTSIAAPTGVTFVVDGSDGTLGVVSWTPGETDHVADIFIRPTSGTTTADDVLVATVDPGSTTYTHAQFKANVDYTVTVRHRDPITNDTSDTDTDNDTTAASPATLDPPTKPQKFAGRQALPPVGLPDHLGLVGIAVKTGVFPCDIEAEVIVEDSPGAGTFSGSYGVIGRVPAQQGTVTPIGMVVPNDGLLRRFRTRQIRATHDASDGASTYSDTVDVMPYTSSPIQQTTKTLRIGAARFGASGATVWSYSSGSVTPVAKTSIGLFAEIVVPAGVQFTGWRIRGNSVSAGAFITADISKGSDGVSAFVGTSLVINDGLNTWETTATQALTEVADGSAYAVILVLDSTAATGASDAAFTWVEFDYVASYLDQTL